MRLNTKVIKSLIDPKNRNRSTDILPLFKKVGELAESKRRKVSDMLIGSKNTILQNTELGRLTLIKLINIM